MPVLIYLFIYYPSIYIYVFMYLCIYVFMYLCIYVFMYLCIYVFIYLYKSNTKDPPSPLSCGEGDKHIVDVGYHTYYAYTCTNHSPI